MLEASLLVAAAVLGAGAACWPKRPKRRGRDLLTAREARRAERRNAPGGIRFGGRVLPEEAEASHFLFVGTTGSGKSVHIGSLMARALRQIEPGSDQRAVIYDAKQDVLSLLHGMGLRCPVVTLNPFDARSAAWDIAKDVTGPASAIQAATILIPEESGNNRFFSDAARDLLAGVMLAFIQTAAGAWTLGDIVFALRAKDRLRCVLKRTPQGEELIDAYFAEGKVLHNILSTLRSRLAPFEPIAAMWSRSEQKVSLRDWIAGEFVLVLGSNESVRAPLDAINRVIVKRLVELLLSQPESRARRSWVFLDEVREAGRLPGLSSLLTKGRSKGAAVVLGFQDVSGMKEAYGEHLATEIMGMCSNKAILRLESGETAAWAARLVGEYEAVEVMESVNADWAGLSKRSRTKSEHRVKADAVLPSEFLSMPPTNMRNGLTGYFLTPFIGAYRATVSLPELLSGLPDEAERSEANFIERSEAEQYLAPLERGGPCTAWAHRGRG